MVGADLDRNAVLSLAVYIVPQRKIAMDRDLISLMEVLRNVLCQTTPDGDAIENGDVIAACVLSLRIGCQSERSAGCIVNGGKGGVGGQTASDSNQILTHVLILRIIIWPTIRHILEVVVYSAQGSFIGYSAVVGGAAGNLLDLCGNNFLVLFAQSGAVSLHGLLNQHSQRYFFVDRRRSGCSDVGRLLRFRTGQPFMDANAGIGGDQEILTIEQPGTILGGSCRMRLIQFKENGEFVFYAIAEHGRHADLPGRLFAAAIIFDDILGLSSESNGDVHCTLQDTVNETIVKGRNLTPSGIGVAAALGDIALYVQKTAFAGPRMGQRVDDQILNACLLSQIDSLKIAGCAVGRFQIDDQVFANIRAADLLTDIQRTGFVLCVNQADLLPDLSVGELGMRGSHLSEAEKQGAECFAGTGRSSKANLLLCQRTLGFFDLNNHWLTSISFGMFYQIHHAIPLINKRDKRNKNLQSCMHLYVIL